VIVGHDDGKQFWFTMSTRNVPPGLVEFIFENHGTQDHEAQFFKLKGNTTEAQVIAALQKPRVQDTLAIAAATGGAGSIRPGIMQHVIERLIPGRYVIVCFDAGPR
jgi:hypothetical protein